MEQIARVLPFIILAAVVLFLIFGKTKTVEQKYKKGTERQFQVAHAEGQIEVSFNQNGIMGRIDDLTGTHAIEYDFAKKWAEAIGQALLYSSVKRRQAGIVLILEGEGDQKHLDKLIYTIRTKRLGIDVWTVQNLKDKKVKIKI
jgi:hypothetical protein